MRVLSSVLGEHRIRFRLGRALLLVVVCAGLAPSASAQRFLPDDPLWSDPDRMDMPLPESRPDAEGVGPFEFLGRMFGVPGEYTEPAQNVNTVGGVPTSSWYTNRHYRFPMTAAALRRGPNRKRGPSMRAPWTVVRFVREGDLPRAVVRDTTGRRFRLLFDARAHPEMATGAAMIGSRLLYALGYNVPHHWLRRIRRRRLRPGPDSGVTTAGIDSLLALTSRRPDSTYRALVTRIPNVVRRIGPFRFRGTRPDDANDVFPHQHRRELRGLRIIAAWIHHSEIQPRHTLDVGVQRGDRQFVRHYLTDLHLTLGSSGATAKPPWSGHEYILELDRIVERVGTLGLSGADWAETDVPDWPAVGYIAADHFAPREWRPEWPNPAFQHCGPADAFWAAKQVRHFTRKDLEAIIATAEYSSPAVANYLLQTLLLRRNAIGRTYLHWGGGLDRFEVQSGRLHFEDVRAKYGLVSDSRTRTVTWHVYDNRAAEVKEKLKHTTSEREALPLPASHAPFLRATLTTGESGTTRVFLRRRRPTAATLARRPTSYEVVGVERTGGGASETPRE